MVFSCATAETQVAEEGSSFENNEWQTVAYHGEVALDGSCTVSQLADLSLDAYYDELCSAFGSLFRNWSLENKQWYSKRLLALCDMGKAIAEKEHPDWLWENPLFTWPILRHQHGIPGETAISQEDALRTVQKHLASQYGVQPAVLDGCIVSAYYYEDQSYNYLTEQPTPCPQYVFQFRDKSKLMYEVWMDAHTGVILQMTQQEAQTCLDEWILANTYIIRRSSLLLTFAPPIFTWIATMSHGGSSNIGKTEATRILPWLYRMKTRKS